MTPLTASAGQHLESFAAAAGPGTGCPAPMAAAASLPLCADPLVALYEAHGAAAFRYLAGMLGNRADAEDALQAAFLELARRPEALQTIEHPRAYLLTTARRIALRRRARTGPRPLREEEERLLEARPHAAPDPGEAEHLQAAIAQLPLEQREVLLLKAFEELTFQEIATVLEISPNTAASRYRYALEKLRTLLATS